jgi:adenylosuccinate lyase
MEVSSLSAISPIDGRYRDKTEALSEFFSEEALMRYRVRVETEYLIFLAENLPQLLSLNTTSTFTMIRSIHENFSTQDAIRIKQIEGITNHDVKAVEYFVKERLQELKLGDYKEFVHFGLTSQDINNTAVPLTIKEALEKLYFTELIGIINRLDVYSETWKDVSLLSRTHGQPATPTRLGKEIKVFSYRLSKQLEVLKHIPITGKFGGAVGNFNAHVAAYPDLDWRALADKFLYERLGLIREQFTTQISNYDSLSALFDAMKRINTILTDLCRDYWLYISMDYFKQKIKEGEIGSSAMPHKINPIDFENAEGNLGIANAIFDFLSSKLPVSRLQRDLTDSTVLRNVGVPIAHSLIAFKSLSKGLDKLLLNREEINNDLDLHPEVIAEAIQTILRRENYPHPYETLKALTRVNEKVSKESIHEFILSLNLSDEIKEQLKAITPHNYTGI